MAGGRCWSISVERPPWLGVRECCSRTLAVSCPLCLLYNPLAAGGAAPCQLCSGFSFPGFWLPAFVPCLISKAQGQRARVASAQFLIRMACYLLQFLLQCGCSLSMWYPGPAASLCVNHHAVTMQMPCDTLALGTAILTADWQLGLHQCTGLLL